MLKYEGRIKRQTLTHQRRQTLVRETASARCRLVDLAQSLKKRPSRRQQKKKNDEHPVGSGDPQATIEKVRRPPGEFEWRQKGLVRCKERGTLGNGGGRPLRREPGR